MSIEMKQPENVVPVRGFQAATRIVPRASSPCWGMAKMAMAQREGHAMARPYERRATGFQPVLGHGQDGHGTT